METQNELVRVLETSGLDKTKSQILLDKFVGYFEIAAEWERKTREIVVSDISQITEMKMAREARLFLSKKRIDVEKTRKELKEDSLREGQTIDAIARILKNLIEPIENQLEQKEKFAQIQEAKKREEVKVLRAEKLASLGVDANLYDLLNMPEVVYETMIIGLQEQIKAKAEAERKAEEARVAKEKADAEMRLENDRLKKEAQEKERLALIEKKKQADLLLLAKQTAELEAKRLKDIADAKLKAEMEANEKIQNEMRAKAEVERKAMEAKAAQAKAESDAKLKAEKSANENLQAELRAKAEAERKAKREAQAEADAELKAKQRAEKKANAAPDKVKLLAFAEIIKDILRPELKTHEGNEILKEAVGMLFNISTFIKNKTNENL